ncbi:MAG TPA: 4-hydroxythreonine-4-phosphate dehydrogenase PdxA [Candidatus Binataceae bacterium]|nr:4-hydroxythreonine-4-phosphate dehydrogenase PdxA [Candidatus Binataceae bacterium]
MTLRRKQPPIVISQGDPAGIGAEVILKAAAFIEHRRRVPPMVVIGDLAAMRAAADRIDGLPEPLEWHPGEPLPAPRRGLAVMSVGRLSAAAYRPAKPSAEGGDAAYRYIVEAARMALRGEAAAVVTAPISKEWLNHAGHHFPGHSELLASLAETPLWRMMFVGTELRLALVTVHIGIAKVPRALSVEKVYRTIALLAKHLVERLGVRRPRIGVLGLNPHAGENGLFGDEEQRFIVPAIRRARRARIDAFGPLAPDTAFGRIDGNFRFDAAVAMYHDQGLIALKTLDFDHAVNVTLGLPFVRTSPDHGTAFDIAGRGRASATSMIAAIDYAWRASAL